MEALSIVVVVDDDDDDLSVTAKKAESGGHGNASASGGASPCPTRFGSSPRRGFRVARASVRRGVRTHFARTGPVRSPAARVGRRR